MKRWSRKIVLNEIQQIFQNGGKINSGYVQSYHPNLYKAAGKYFGSWGPAVVKAGFDYNDVRLKKPFRHWSIRAITKAIQIRKRKGLPINCVAVYKQDRGLYQAAIRYLGSWRKAMRLAGFNPKDYDPRIKWTREKVLQEIQKRYSESLPLNTGYLTKNGCQSLIAAANKFFGNWRKAIKSAGIDYAEVMKQKIKWWSKKRVLEKIRKLEKEGTRLNSKNMQSNYCDLFGIAIKLFGSWGEAVEQAGISYRKHLKTWSYKHWLRTSTKNQLLRLDKQAVAFAKERRKC